MKLADARAIAEDIVRMISPYCYRCEIGGSIRREKPDVKDIEIVCEPNRAEAMQGNLFAEEYERDRGFTTAVLSLGQKLKGNPQTGKYVRMCHNGIDIDIFIAEKDNYGLIKFIRTGSAEWIQKQFVEMNKRGLIRCEGGWLIERLTDVPLCTSEEIDVFRWLKIKWKEPQKREA